MPHPVFEGAAHDFIKLYLVFFSDVLNTMLRAQDGVDLAGFCIAKIQCGLACFFLKVFVDFGKLLKAYVWIMVSF